MRTRHQILAVLLCFSTAPAGAQSVIAGNPTSPYGGGISVWGATSIANYFSLASAKDVTSISWTALVFSNFDRTASFRWDIFADAAGLPGAELYGGVASGVVGASIPSSAGAGAGLLVFSEAVEPAKLDAGEYWLALRQYTDNVNGNAYWTYSSETGTAAINSGSKWNSLSGKYAFSISGVDAVTATPEPATFALLGTGLISVFGFVRRKRAA